MALFLIVAFVLMFSIFFLLFTLVAACCDDTHLSFLWVFCSISIVCSYFCCIKDFFFFSPWVFLLCSILVAVGKSKTLYCFTMVVLFCFILLPLHQRLSVFFAVRFYSGCLLLPPSQKRKCVCF